MKAIKLKRAAGTICFIFVFLSVFSGITHLMERKDSMEQFSEFWSDPTDYDVCFFGNSHMFYGVLPMELWKDHDIRSYVLAASNSRPAQMYWTLVNVLDYAKPKVAVIDCYAIQHETKISAKENVSYLIHNGFDAIPFSLNKIRAVMDLFDTPEKRIEYLFDFSIYHNRWEELEQEDFVPDYNVQKGGKINTLLSDQSDYQMIAETDMAEEETIGYSYIRKAIELCQENDIAVILTAIPYCNEAWAQQSINGVARLSEEYSVPFLNMQYEDALEIDYQTDFRDSGHLNFCGQQKTSEYIGNYLAGNFDFSKDYLEESEIEKWENDYLVYSEKKITWLKKQKKLQGYLMWLEDEKFLCEIYQKEETEDTSAIGKLLNHISQQQTISKEKAIEEFGEEFDGEFAFIVKNAETEEVVDKAVFNNEERT